MNRKLLLGLLFFCSGSAVLGWFAYSRSHPKGKPAPVPATAPAFVIRPGTGPDALIATQNLADLPKDLLKLPLVKEILTEDFVFYYQEAPDVLSLYGSLKRLAFEHNVTFVDRLFATILSGPAELALWRSPSGRLDEGLLILPNQAAAGLLKVAQTVAAADSQLSVFNEPEAKPWPETVYRYEFRPHRVIYLTSWKDHLVVFTHPGIPVPAHDTLIETYDDQLGKDKHHIYLSMDYLSFGYQHFLSNFSTVKVIFNDSDNWTAASLTPAQDKIENFAPETLWSVLPQKASLCFAATVDGKKSAALIDSSFGDLATSGKKILEALQKPLGVCWYEDSKMYTPLIVARVQGPLDPAALKKIFNFAVGNVEAGILTPEEQQEKARQQEALEKGETVDNPVKPKKFVPPLAVTEEQRGTDWVWRREISSRYGLTPATKSQAHAKMRSKRFFTVEFAYVKDYLIFSPDHQLVEKTIAVLNKKYPALADSFDVTPRAGLLVFPANLAELLRQTTLESLPAEQEALFRESVTRHVFPALDRFKKFPATAFIWPEPKAEKKVRFEELKWQSLSVR